MAVLKSPNINWNNGVTAPQSVAELVPIAHITVFIVPSTLVTLPMPTLGGGATPPHPIGTPI